MAVDKRLKHKKKREEKQKARKQEAERYQRLDKAEEYGWFAEDAYRHEDYPEALKWALKKLKLAPDDQTTRIALYCAAHLKEDAVLLNLLERLYRQGSLASSVDYLNLAKVAARQKNYALGREVMEALVAELNSPTARFRGSVSKPQRREIQELLIYLRGMEAREAAIGRKNRRRLPPRFHLVDPRSKNRWPGLRRSAANPVSLPGVVRKSKAFPVSRPSSKPMRNQCWRRFDHSARPTRRVWIWPSKHTGYPFAPPTTSFFACRPYAECVHCGTRKRPPARS